MPWINGHMTIGRWRIFVSIFHGLKILRVKSAGWLSSKATEQIRRALFRIDKILNNQILLTQRVISCLTKFYFRTYFWYSTYFLDVPKTDTITALIEFLYTLFLIDEHTIMYQLKGFFVTTLSPRRRTIVYIIDSTEAIWTYKYLYIQLAWVVD